MNMYSVNPPINDDLDYYRADDDVVAQVLSGKSMLCVGLRRSGKTSFLLKVQRAASRLQKAAHFFDVSDILQGPAPRKTLSQMMASISALRNSIILLDEVEVFSTQKLPSLAKIFQAAANQNCIIMTCTPDFVVEIPRYSVKVQTFLEKCHRHVIGPVNETEAEGLLRQAKRKSERCVSDDTIKRILESNERMPIVLQALGRLHTEGVDLIISLAGLGNRILAGLNERMRNALLEIAHDAQHELSHEELSLLVALGALRKSSPDGVEAVPEIASEILKNFLCQSSYVRPGISRVVNDWKRCATILHLADLHFGPNCVADANGVTLQLSRLTEALERFHIVPDFVALTGDLSWSGNRKEFETAEKFLIALSEWLAKQFGEDLQTVRRRFLIIPGNHDAAWALSKGLAGGEEDDFIMFSTAVYSNVVNRFHSGAIFWDMEKPCLTRIFPEHSLAFVLASTAHTITQKQKKGELGRAVQDMIVEALGRADCQGALFRIGLIHHNLVPFHNDGECLKDAPGAGIAFSNCRPGFDFILHGHVHQGEVDYFYPRQGHPPIPYSCVGSFGVQAEHRPGEPKLGYVPNEFAVIDLESNRKARRFTTRFYHHTLTTTSDWKWDLLRQHDPIVLG